MSMSVMYVLQNEPEGTGWRSGLAAARAPRTVPFVRLTVSSVCCGDGWLGARSVADAGVSGGVAALQSRTVHCANAPHARACGCRLPAVERRCSPGAAGRRAQACPRARDDPSRSPIVAAVPILRVWYWKSRRTLLSAAVVLCRRIGSPARSGVVAGVAAHAGCRGRADADAAHRRGACLAGTFVLKANLTLDEQQSMDENRGQMVVGIRV